MVSSGRPGSPSPRSVVGVAQRTVLALEEGYLELATGRAAEVIYVGADDNEAECGWIYARALESGDKGWLPLDCLDLLPEQLTALGPKPTSNSPAIAVLAVKDPTATAVSQDLPTASTCLGSNDDNNNNTNTKTRTHSRESHFASTCQPGCVLGPAVALRGSVADDPGYLALSVGESIIIEYVGSPGRGDAGWLFGHSVDRGFAGWFLADVLTKPPAPAGPPPPQARIALAEAQGTLSSCRTAAAEIQLTEASAAKSSNDQAPVPLQGAPTPVYPHPPSRGSQRQTETGVAAQQPHQGVPATSSWKHADVQGSDKELSLAEVCQAAAAKGLRLVGALAPSGTPWKYPLVDVQNGCFCGHLPAGEGPSPQGTEGLSKQKASSLLRAVMRGIEDVGGWDRPEGAFGTMARGTKWLVDGSCSCPYRYGGITVDPVSPFPPWMHELMQLCLPLCGLLERNHWPNSCNLNCYADGSDSLDWHADNEALFGGRDSDCCIISLSLGEERRFELRPEDRRGGEPPGPTACRLQLRSGDLCTMEGRTQRFYQHRVPKGPKGGGSRLRVNLTWRWIAAHDRRRCGLRTLAQEGR
ncbi:unnamed protein product [Polarella glacialis]|uniref:Fe2OG dioxygenase domain-containing protein n=1 Tax=Polarella glacialis TaxID=89957 RepID=A0A813KV71_POLGL|nr:unnamed protein product [Polarella glacialis]CAE8731848.1 unnamed protein product [Polarella glacialis]